jgi:hypothetical protein
MATVYRGSTSLTGTTTTTTVTLGTPVAVGESFVVASVKSQVDRGDSSLPVVFLKTEVSGEYTELEITRIRGATSEDITVAWQVITGSEFTVQNGTATIGSGSSTTTAAISTVDTSIAFPVIYFAPSTGGTGGPQNCGINVAFNSTTELGFSRDTTAGTSTIRWQVVEWTGATVATYTTTLSGTSVNSTITAVDMDSTFVVNYFNCSGAIYDGRISPKVTLTTTTNIQTTRDNSNNDIDLRFFVVSHPDISVQRGTIQMTSTVASNTATVSSVDTTKSFLMTHIAGNSQNNASSNDERSNHVLTDATTVTVSRIGTGNLTDVSYQLVEFVLSSNIKTINGLAYASVKTVNGLAIASVKTVNGLA